MEHTVQILVVVHAHGMVGLTRVFHPTRIQEAHHGIETILMTPSSQVAIRLVIPSVQKPTDGDSNFSKIEGLEYRGPQFNG